MNDDNITPNSIQNHNWVDHWAIP